MSNVGRGSGELRNELDVIRIGDGEFPREVAPYTYYQHPRLYSHPTIGKNVKEFSELTKEEYNEITVLNWKNSPLLTKLPKYLPVYLRELKFVKCNITYLPELPKTLIKLYCQENQIEKLPELPTSLSTLECHNNKLIELPELPSNLIHLICSDNKLTSLPTLPEELEMLCCTYNKIEKIPNWPLFLVKLYITHNKFKELPEVEPSKNNLEILYCGENKLEKLPRLSTYLTILVCYENKLKNLPKLPNSLKKLYCENNELTTLPELPDSLENVNCGDNPITYLPRSVTKMDSYNAALHEDGEELKAAFLQRRVFYRQNFLYSDTPIHHIVNTFFKGRMEKYFEFDDKCLKKFANKISEWFLDCKYNPKYKYCQKRLEQEYKNDYMGDCKQS